MDYTDSPEGKAELERMERDEWERQRDEMDASEPYQPSTKTIFFAPTCGAMAGQL